MNTLVFLRSFVFLFAFGALVVCDSDNNSSSPPAPEEPVADPPAPELGSIVDVARDAGSFSTLLTALEAAGLDATLADEDVLHRASLTQHKAVPSQVARS